MKDEAEQVEQLSQKLEDQSVALMEKECDELAAGEA